VKLLGLPRVGLLSLIWVVVGYFSLLDFGLGLALTKIAAVAIADDDRAKVTRLYRTATRAQLTMGIVGGIIMAIFAPYLVRDVLSVPINLEHEALDSVYICAAAFPFVLLVSSATGMLQAAQRFDAINLVQAPLGIGQFVLPLVCAIWSTNLAIIVGALVVSRVVGLIILTASVKKLVPMAPDKGLSTGGELRSLVAFGGWVSVSNIVSPLMVYADRFLVGSLQAISSVAYYSVPSDATLRLLIAPRSLVSAMFPVMSATRDVERLRDLVLRSVRYILLLVGIPSLILFFAAHEVMTVWVGESFAARSSVVLQILLIGIVANSVAQVPFAVIQATGRADLTARLHLAEIVPYILIAYFSIRVAGIEGAAFAWSLRVIVDASILSFLAHGRLGLSLTDLLGHRIPQIISTLAVVAAAAFAFHSVIGAMSSQWVATLCLAAVMVSVGWTWFLTKGERDRLLQSVSPRSRRAL
jgi:O-antigen/teichoic acid export membrane protein